MNLLFAAGSGIEPRTIGSTCVPVYSDMVSFLKNVASESRGFLYEFMMLCTYPKFNKGFEQHIYSH